MRETSSSHGFSFAVVLATASSLLFPLAAFATVRPHHRSLAHASIRHAVSMRPAHVEHAYAGLTMSSERATQIQTALVKQGYLSGEPTGSWDSSSYAAMQKLQSDNGWQTKLVPDSRALIKLGLGPGTTPEPSLAPGLNAATPQTPSLASDPITNPASPD